MAESLLRTSNEVAEIYHRHAKTVYRVCFAYMKNPADTDDAASETFVKLMKSKQSFENEEHEKAWLIRTATNVCKDFVKHWSRKNENIDDYSEKLSADESFEVDEVMEAICRLPDKYKTVIYLFYFEGYACPEIAKMVGKPHSTVRYHLQEARKILKERLGDDFDEK